MKTAALAALLLAAAPAAAAERNYSVTSFDRIRVDGPYQVSLKTNVAPFARASGSQAAIDGVSIRVEGRTMVVRANNSGGWGGYPGQDRGAVTIELGTHELSSAWLNGPGAIHIDKVKGLSFDLNQQGAGSTQIAAADIDQLRISVDGAGSTRLAGKAGKLTASVRGSATFDGEMLNATDALITAEGPTMVRANVRNSAKVNAFGLASVTLAGGAACEVKTHGSASVSGCK
jgi:hypothetical protein